MTGIQRHSGLNPNAIEVAHTQNLYGPAGELRDVSHGSNGQSRGGYGYARDVNGRIMSMNVDGVERSFGHDDNAQLISEPGKTYAYDENGNRTTTVLHQTGDDNRLKSDDVYDYEYDAEGNRTKRTHRQGQQVTTYAYDHRNRLIEVETEAVPPATISETVTPDVFSGAVGYFKNGENLPAGTYTIAFAGGAVDWTGATYADDWTVNGHGGHYVYLVVSGTTESAAPGTAAFFATAAEASADGLGTSVTITHAGGPIGVYMRDTEFTNNVLDESVGAPAFTMSYVSALPPAHERYFYDTSDRRVVVEKDVDNDTDFDATDTKESFVHDGDEIALVFDKSNAIQNRYLHGPGVDNVLAEEGTRGSAWNTHWLLGDHQNSVRQVIDDAGKVQNKTDYDAAGNIVSETNVANASDYTWGGGRDGRTTGSIHMGLREYDPFSGTFHQPDPYEQYTNDRVFGGNNFVAMVDYDGGNAFDVGASVTRGMGGMMGAGSSFGSWFSGTGGASSPTTMPTGMTGGISPALSNFVSGGPMTTATPAPATSGPVDWATYFRGYTGSPGATVQPTAQYASATIRTNQRMYAAPAGSGPTPVTWGDRHVQRSREANQALLNIGTGMLNGAFQVMTLPVSALTDFEAPIVRTPQMDHDWWVSPMHEQRVSEWEERINVGMIVAPMAKAAVATRWGNLAAEARGVIYRRTNPMTGRQYIGQAKDFENYLARQRRHDNALRIRHDYEIVERVPSDKVLLDLAEETHIRANGGPRAKGGRLDNLKYQVSEPQYRGAGGTVDKPTR